MATKIFLLGRPGSGKSEAARFIEEIARLNKIPYSHIGDYPILYSMYQKDTGYQKFQPADPLRPELGFNVTDYSVLDDALRQLQKEIKEKDKQDGIVLIELARDNYQTLFQQLPPEIYRGYVIFTEAELDKCIERVQRRAYRNRPGSIENNKHLISEEIIRKYYSADNYQYMADPQGFAKDFSIDKDKILAIRNDGSFKDFLKQVRRYVTQNIIPEQQTEKEADTFIDRYLDEKQQIELAKRSR